MRLQGFSRSSREEHHLELLTDEAVQETEAAWGEACIEAAESAITSLEIFQPKLDACHEGLMILEGMNPLKDNLHSPSPVYERELRVVKDKGYKFSKDTATLATDRELEALKKQVATKSLELMAKLTASTPVPAAAIPPAKTSVRPAMATPAHLALELPNSMGFH